MVASASPEEGPKGVFLPAGPQFPCRRLARRISASLRALACLLGCALAGALGGTELPAGIGSVAVQSAILRNRVVVLDKVTMKKALYAAFTLSIPRERGGRIEVRGRLSRGGQLLGKATVVLAAAGERSGSLVFDLPFEFAAGKYTISVTAYDGQGNALASGSRAVDRGEMGSESSDASAASAVPRAQPRRDNQADSAWLATATGQRGYAIFARSPMAYVQPGAKPRAGEMIEYLAASAVRNATAVLNFSIYSLRALGRLRIGTTELRQGSAVVSKDNIQLACVVPVADGTGLPEGRFRYLPTLIKPLRAMEDLPADCSRVWITVTIPPDAAAGTYSGTVTIAPERAPAASLPVRLTVNPITLEDVPGLDYCMLMTYEFVELTMPWSADEKAQIYRAATSVLRDYLRHGMTTLCLHSPFVLRTDMAGSPALDDIFAALRASRDAGFRRPVVWYMGHLIQTSKPRHPGNILGFDGDVHLPRLTTLVRAVSEFARQNGLPEVIVLPIDEPDDTYQDVGGRRAALAPVLVDSIRKAGARAMVTAEQFSRAGRPDYVAAPTLRAEEVRAAHDAGARYWRYENRVTTQCDSPAYARYQYGFQVWKNGIDGMSSWTFQNTQNAGGLPGSADTASRDIYLAYPAPAGPLATLKWEAIREGIDDRKLTYQLEQRVERLKSSGKDAARYSDFLERLKLVDLQGCCDANSCTQEVLSSLDRQRNALVDLILQADRDLP